jgi:hypothetical protein
MSAVFVGHKRTRSPGFTATPKTVTLAEDAFSLESPSISLLTDRAYGSDCPVRLCQLLLYGSLGAFEQVRGMFIGEAHFVPFLFRQSHHS